MTKSSAALDMLFTADRELYIRMPQGYPKEAGDFLQSLLGPDCRWDIVQGTKEGFGLPDSPGLCDLRKRLNFEKHWRAVDGWQKFCGRGKRQNPETFEVEHCVNECVKDVKEVPQQEAGDRVALVPVEKQHSAASAGGQLNWAVRQACHHLQAGISRCQQMAGLDDPETFSRNECGDQAPSRAHDCPGRARHLA